jgi:hypothetical protein
VTIVDPGFPVALAMLTHVITRRSFGASSWTCALIAGPSAPNTVSWALSDAVSRVPVTAPAIAPALVAVAVTTCGPIATFVVSTVTIHRPGPSATPASGAPPSIVKPTASTSSEPVVAPWNARGHDDRGSLQTIARRSPRATTQRTRG